MCAFMKSRFFRKILYIYLYFTIYLHKSTYSMHNILNGLKSRGHVAKQSVKGGCDVLTLIHCSLMMIGSYDNLKATAKFLYA